MVRNSASLAAAICAYIGLSEHIVPASHDPMRHTDYHTVSLHQLCIKASACHVTGALTIEMVVSCTLFCWR